VAIGKLQIFYCMPKSDKFVHIRRSGNCHLGRFRLPEEIVMQSDQARELRRQHVGIPCNHSSIEKEYDRWCAPPATTFVQSVVHAF